MDKYSAEEIEAFFKREQAKEKQRKRRNADLDDRHKIGAMLTRERRKPYEEWPFDSRDVGRMIWMSRLRRGSERVKIHRQEAIRINRKSRRLTKEALKRGQDIDPDQFEERLPYID